jgi:2-phosphoglycerate kinase
MKISDSFLNAQLQNVFWIGGAGYGGKTTITNFLASKHGFQPYHPEDLFHLHKQAASPEDHPSLHAPFHGWEWFFNRPIDEYIQWIDANGREQFEMVVLDLVKLNAQAKVVIDGFLLDPWLLKRLTEYSKIIFLYADEETIRKGFFSRADKQDLVDVVNTLSDPARTREHTIKVVCEHSARKRAEADAAGFKVLVRNSESSLQETLATVEKHFGLR